MKCCIRCNKEYLVGEAYCSICKTHLTNVDDSIMYTVFQLNNKGYKTSYCCGGHVTLNSNKHGYPTFQIYIAFEEGTVIPTPPVGFVREENVIKLGESREDNTVESMLAKIAEENIKLYNWAKEL